MICDGNLSNSDYVVVNLLCEAVVQRMVQLVWSAGVSWWCYSVLGGGDVRVRIWVTMIVGCLVVNCLSCLTVCVVFSRYMSSQSRLGYSLTSRPIHFLFRTESLYVWRLLLMECSWECCYLLKNIIANVRYMNGGSTIWHGIKWFHIMWRMIIWSSIVVYAWYCTPLIAL